MSTNDDDATGPHVSVPSVAPGKPPLRVHARWIVDVVAIGAVSGLAWSGKISGEAALVVISLVAGVWGGDALKRFGGGDGSGKGLLWPLAALAGEALKHLGGKA